MKTYDYNRIDYIYPKAYVLSDNGIGQSEYAARQCYNSFEKSENECISDLKSALTNHEDIDNAIANLKGVETSELLKSLSFVHFHESTLEHSVISYLLTDFSRGVLQELARHRIASYSVMSTRYTLANLINAFTASLFYGDSVLFIEEVLKYDMFVTSDPVYNRIELKGIYDKLMYQFNRLGQEKWLELTVAKSVREHLNIENDNFETTLEVLNSKDKRNVGDSFKHVITDNFRVNAVVTFNLRSLKNFFKLRDSGAAWFQIDKLAKEMKRVTPDKYLKLIIRDYQE